MSVLKPVDYSEFKRVIPEFRAKAEEFFDGKMNIKDYKGFSGKYGSYAQRGGKKSMLRLRMNAGRVTPEKLRFTADMIRKHNVDLDHFTTCQTIQLHNLDLDAVCDIMDKALDAGIVCYGGGGDYPRNVMASPLSGTEEEYFDVMPYAEAAAQFLLDFIDQDKMPRKLKVAFSNNKKNSSHATFRDLGFVANENGTFDVYAAGGLGNNPKFGVLVKEDIDKNDILYCIEAMIRVFREHGNYENRTKARTRYMQETLGADKFREEFNRQFDELKQEKDLSLEGLDASPLEKEGAGEPLEESFIVHKQYNSDLYTLAFHPRGGAPKPETLEKLADAIEGMKGVELRLSPDEGSYIINLTADEARTILPIIEDEAAKNEFETSIGCIGASICQVGLRDSQSLLKRSLDAVKEAGIADNALPQIHISGCPSSCGTHQVGSIGFRGGLKVVDKKPVPTFILFVNGNDVQGEERMGREVGMIADEKIPEFLVALGQTVMESGKDFDTWMAENPEGIDAAAGSFLL